MPSRSRRRLELLTLLTCLFAVTFVPSAFASYASVVAGDSPELHLRLGESSGTTAEDATSNNRDGAVSGASVGQPGALSGNGSFSFDGTDDYVDVSYSSQPTTNYSFELWFKTGRPTQGFASARSTATGGTRGRSLYLENGQVCYAIDINLSDYPRFCSSEAGYADRRWHQVVITVESGVGMKMYIDGELDETDTRRSSSSYTGASHLVLGYGESYYQYHYQYTRYATVGDVYTRGYLDEVSLYSSVLSAGEVEDHYDAAQAELAPSPLPAVDAVLAQHPRAYWRLNDASNATSAEDISDLGTQLPATINGNTAPDTAGAPIVRDAANRAFAFDGTDNLTLSSTSWNNQWNYVGSFEAWIKVDATSSTAKQVIWDEGQAVSGIDRMKLSVTPTSVHARWGYQGYINGPHAVDYDWNLPENIGDKWVHVAWTINTWSNGLSAAYLNGQPLGTRAPPNNIQSGPRAGSGTAYIGSDQSGANGLDGAMDEVAYFTTELDAAAVQGHYIGGSGGYRDQAKQGAPYGPPPAANNNAEHGDPVNVVSGNLTDTALDLQLPGKGLPFQFARFYNAQDESLPELSTSPLGRGWTHTYATQLIESIDGTVTLREGTGARHTFTPTSGGDYSSPTGNHDELDRISGGAYTLERSNGVVWSFDADGKLTEIEDRNGNALTFAYIDGLLTQVTDTAGREVDFAYSARRLISITDETNRDVTFAYTSGNLTGVTDTRGNTTSYAYDSENRMSSKTTPSESGNPGSTTSFTYDSADRATAVNGSDDIGDMTVAYDPANSKSTVTDARSDAHVFNYNSGGYIVDIDEPGNVNDREFTFDSAGNRTSSTDELGKTTDYEYDSAGNLTELKQPAPSSGASRPTWTYTYDSYRNLLTSEDPRGGDTTIVYDGDGNPTSITDAENNETVTTYNSAGQPLTVTNPRGKVRTYTYDSDGNVDTITDDNSEVVDLDHDALGRLTQKTDELGRETDYEYDAADHLTEITAPVPAVSVARPVTTFEYDVRGNRISVTDPLNHETTQSFDKYNRLVGTTDATSRTTGFTYDDDGNLTKVTDPASNETTHTYDTMDRLVKTVEPDGTSPGIETEYTRDATGRVIEVEDPNGHVTELDYDHLGRLIKTTDPENGETEFEYGSTGLMTEMTNANDHSWTYAYDLLGQLTSKTDPLSESYSFTYDANGNLSSRTDAEAQATSYSYDDLDRQTGVDYPGSATDVTRTFDDASQLTQVVDAAGTTGITYDGLGRVTDRALPGSRAVSYGYDAASRRTSMSLPNSKSVAYTYDNADRLSGTTFNSTHASTYAYDTAGRLDSVTTPGGKHDYTRDEAGRVTSLALKDSSPATLLSRDYTYDKASNVTQITDENSDDSDFTYDDANRLLSETHAVPSPVTRTYTYDPAGNRTSLVTGGNTTNYTYSNAEEMTAAGSSTFAYNDNGEMTSRTDGGNTINYSYDADGNQVEAGAEDYVYDSAGQRVSKTAGGNTTDYVFDGSQVVQEKTGSAVDTYQRGIEGRLLMQQSGSSTPTFPILDAQNTRTGLTDSNEDITDEWSYNAFGDERDHAGTTPSPFGYLGNTASPATKTHDFHARSYDAANGRFLSRDPVEGDPTWPATLNPYGHGGGNPLANPDPTGLRFWGDARSVLTGALDALCTSGQKSACLDQQLMTGSGGHPVADYLVGQRVSGQQDHESLCNSLKGGLPAVSFPAALACNIGSMPGVSFQAAFSTFTLVDLSLMTIATATIATVGTGMCIGATAGVGTPACVIGVGGPAAAATAGGAAAIVKVEGPHWIHATERERKEWPRWLKKVAKDSGPW